MRRPLNLLVIAFVGFFLISGKKESGEVWVFAETISYGFDSTNNAVFVEYPQKLLFAFEQKEDWLRSLQKSQKKVRSKRSRRPKRYEHYGPLELPGIQLYVSQEGSILNESPGVIKDDLIGVAKIGGPKLTMSLATDLGELNKNETALVRAYYSANWPGISTQVIPESEIGFKSRYSDVLFYVVSFNDTSDIKLEPTDSIVGIYSINLYEQQR